MSAGAGARAPSESSSVSDEEGEAAAAEEMPKKLHINIQPFLAKFEFNLEVSDNKTFGDIKRRCAKDSKITAPADELVIIIPACWHNFYTPRIPKDSDTLAYEQVMTGDTLTLDTRDMKKRSWLQFRRPGMEVDSGAAGAGAAEAAGADAVEATGAGVAEAEPTQEQEDEGFIAAALDALGADTEDTGAGAMEAAEAAGADAAEAAGNTHFDDGPLADDMKVVLTADGKALIRARARPFVPDATISVAEFTEKYMKALKPGVNKESCMVYRIDSRDVQANDVELYCRVSDQLAPKEDDILLLARAAGDEALTFVLFMKGRTDQRRVKPLKLEAGEYLMFNVPFPHRAGHKAMAKFRIDVVHCFKMLGRSYGNAHVRGSDSAAEDAEVTMDALDEKYADVSSWDFHKVVGDAFLKTSEQRDAWEKALTRPSVLARLEALRKEREEYTRALQSCVYFIENDARVPDVEYPDDFTAAAHSLEYDCFNPDTGCTITVTDDTIERQLYRTHAQAICGEAGAGKTLMHIAKAKRYCRRLGKDRFILLQSSVEPLAILSARGELGKVGAIVVSELDMHSVRGSLTKNQQKVLFDVRYGGTIECKRWHAINFPRNLPRLFSLNGSVKEWLEIFGDVTAHDRAAMRRICIAGYSRPLPSSITFITLETKANLEVAELDDAAADAEREAAWWASRGGRRERLAGTDVASSSNL